jgi:hypothetical protein
MLRLAQRLPTLAHWRQHSGWKAIQLRHPKALLT